MLLTSFASLTTGKQRIDVISSFGLSNSPDHIIEYLYNCKRLSHSFDSTQIVDRYANTSVPLFVENE